MANTLALHAARVAASTAYEDVPRMTLYVSEQTHYCISKGAAFVGFNPSLVRVLPTVSASNPRVSVSALEQAVQADIAAGLLPAAIVAMGGTTNSGVVDDLAAVAAVADKYGVWFHVDGAYGAPFNLTERGRVVLRGMELADSVAVDPHKGLFIPYGLGALLVRDVSALRAANSADGACMQPPAMQDAALANAEPGAMYDDTMNLGLELTRDFRGLAMWLPLKLLGADVFRAQLDKAMDLAVYAADALSTAAAEHELPLEVVTRPTLSVFTFKVTRALPHDAHAHDAARSSSQHDSDAGFGAGIAELAGTADAAAAIDDANVALLRGVHRRGRVLLSPHRSVSGAPGELCLRMAVLSPATSKATVEAAVEDVVAETRSLCGRT